DYENRIIKITKDGNDIAEFAYDALGRRIRKIDSIAGTTRLYFYNDKWQVLTETDASETMQAWYAYGNYIDEVLLTAPANFWVLTRCYVHDHLYSPAALTTGSGTVLERYEYDAYGEPTIWDPTFSSERSSSSYDNPYYFTGRRADFLDGGNLTLQINRHRYYDYYTGRWLTHDPLGITPNAPKPNRFEITKEYTDALNLYEYVKSQPSVASDPAGLFGLLPPNVQIVGKKRPKCGNCGVDVSFALVMMQTILDGYYSIWSADERDQHCTNMVSGNGWEIEELHNPFMAPQPRGCGDCPATVAIRGNCYSIHEVNYYLWGAINKLCGNSWAYTKSLAWTWANVAAPCMARIGGISCEGSPESKTNWAKAGYYNNLSLPAPSKSEFSDCKASSGASGWGGSFRPKWGSWLW
ncbi:MAG: RHS repeat domain-containing protein, partial [Planctomycetota bacterium]